MTGYERVLPAYGSAAEGELPADIGLARSVVPAGTAATRDFSHLGAGVPLLDATRCVGCMACLSGCPDAALFATALPERALFAALAPAAGHDADAVAGVLARFASTRKYGDVPAKRGDAPALFGIFVDAERCKGCAECVAVCTDLGHDALRMADKDPEGALVERLRAEMALFRTLPPTPPAYRSEKALVDLMLAPEALGYTGGAGSCPGCGEGTAIRMLVAATRVTAGLQGMAIVAATGCNSVFAGTYPYDPYLVPWTSSLFENAAADAMGIRLRWDQTGHEQRRLWVIGGDGAMYDIGFQSLSRLVASGMDVKVLVLDTQVYSNTGGQASTASFGGQVTKLTAFGKKEHGKVERRKELGRILMAHGEVYVAQTTPAHPEHFYRSVLDANSYPGPAVVIVYAACIPEHGIADDMAARQSKLAVQTRAFPLFTYDPRRGERMSQRLSLQGNPAVAADWATGPDGASVDFLAFARTETRFAQHFSAKGGASPELIRTRDDRLQNWRMLQELAGCGS